MSPASFRVAAILLILVPTVELILVPTVELGGAALLQMITRRDPGYLDNPVRRYFFRAGHAHAGVWLVFALVGLLYVDQADLSDTLKQFVRWGFAAGPILMPLGFFLSIIPPRAERPNGVLALVFLGALALAFATVTLGIGLFRT